MTIITICKSKVLHKWWHFKLLVWIGSGSSRPVVHFKKWNTHFFRRFGFYVKKYESFVRKFFFKGPLYSCKRPPNLTPRPCAPCHRSVQHTWLLLRPILEFVNKCTHSHPAVGKHFTKKVFVQKIRIFLCRIQICEKNMHVTFKKTNFIDFLKI